MQIRLYLTTYNRPEMLHSTLVYLRSYGLEPIVYEDGVTHEFRGKQKYWMTWDEILKDCKDNPADLYIFMPEDFEDLDYYKILELHERFKANPYVYNIINDGRYQSWTRFLQKTPIDGTEEVGFCDCGFFCNREALEVTNWKVKPIDPNRWEVNPNLSSGVGEYLTRTFSNYGVKMYKPVKSLAYHGDHESMMNPEERKRNPLISK